MVQFSISQETLRADFAVKQLTNFYFKDVKTSVMIGGKTFFDSWIGEVLWKKVFKPSLVYNAGIECLT